MEEPETMIEPITPIHRPWYQAMMAFFVGALFFGGTFHAVEGRVLAGGFCLFAGVTTILAVRGMINVDRDWQRLHEAKKRYERKR